MDLPTRRETLRRWFDVALAGIDPEALTAEGLSAETNDEVTLIAIGKAATAMCRGAAQRLQRADGVCVAIAPDAVPEGIELIVGDHPNPGEASFQAGRRVLEVARTRRRIVALISGGGSALCEYPIPGVGQEFIKEVNRVLLSSGASITDTNLVRRHLSAVKGGGLLRVAGRPIDTYAISDVCGADPSVIASGPTLPTTRTPDEAIAIMSAHGIDIPPGVSAAMMSLPDLDIDPGAVQVIADGHTAARAVAEQVANEGLTSSVRGTWLSGPLDGALDQFIKESPPGITIAAGEPEVKVEGDGKGGRNTHAALLAATRLAGTGQVFAAFATDGLDGNSSSAGAIVDGTTISRGGDPQPALARYDSATYLGASGDLVVTGPTGTNVSDLWMLWK